MSKKASSLSLETVVIAIIILIVLVLIVFFVLKYGGQLTEAIGDQAKISKSLVPNISRP